jgi:hypothetical protein
MQQTKLAAANGMTKSSMTKARDVESKARPLAHWTIQGKLLSIADRIR